MSFRSTLLAAAALSLTALAPAVADVGPAQPDADTGSRAASAPEPSDRVILRFKAGVDAADREAARDEAGAEEFASLGKRFQVIGLPADVDPADAVAALKDNPDVIDAQIDGYSEVHAAPAPDDPLFTELWGLDNTGQSVAGQPATAGSDISALDAWAKTTGDDSVVVAVLDTGYRPNHPDLADALWTNTDEIAGNNIDDDGNGYVDDVHGMDFSGANIDLNPIVFDNDPTDDIPQGGHGVHTAGTIAAEGNNGIGITGVAQKARVMPLRACGLSPSAGGVRCAYSSQIAAINYAGANGAKIANMSLGGTGRVDLVRDAFAANPGVLFVISAGNDGKDVEVSGQTTYPCSFDPTESSIAGAVDNIVCVAASTQNDSKASFSNWGKQKVDVAAPGTETLSAYVQRSPINESFGSSGWPYQGWTDGGWTRSFSAALNAQSISNDTATQTNGTTRTVMTPKVTVPATSCQLNMTRAISKSGSDIARYEIWVDDVMIDAFNPSSSGAFFRGPFTISGAGNHTLQARFSYTRNGGTTSNGMWLSNVSFGCFVPPGSEDGDTDYAYLQGTSMAAPHVAGTAALLSSYEPKATTMQMKQALLSTVEAIPAFNPDTGATPIATGGRVNADAALSAIDAAVTPDTSIIGTPTATSAGAVTFSFGQDSKAPATFQCKIDAGSYAACTSPKTFTALSTGDHTVSVRARDGFGNTDPTPATFTIPVDRATPTVSSVSPASGSILGNTTITLTGTGFWGTPTVTVGGNPCGSVSRTGTTKLTCTTAAVNAPTVANVQLVNPDTKSVSKVGAFTYTADAPTVTGVSPVTGPIAGGTPITITGTGFWGTPSVTVGDAACANPNRLNATTITCTTAAAAAPGAVTVRVTNQDAKSGEKAGPFTYTAEAPTVTNVSPATGPIAGGTPITITGTGFWGTPTVTIGGEPCASPNRQNATTITCQTPGASGPGAVTVQVTNQDAKSGGKASAFTYETPAPTITAVTPNTGPMAGGSAITITGTGFYGAPEVSIGGTPCAAVVRVDDTSLTCATPAAAAAGPAVVEVRTAGGTTSLAGGFTYVAPVDPIDTTPKAVGTISGLTAKRATSGKSVRLRWTAATNAVRYEFGCTTKGKQITKWRSTTATSARCTKLKPTKAAWVSVRAVGVDTFSPAVSKKVKARRR